MALDFPSSPVNGQAYNGYVYSSSIGGWQVKPSAQSPFYTSDTPPANPVAGDSWFNTNDGSMYIYYNDGNTSQWVEHRSEIARSQVGLVPVTPTSLQLDAGTASFDMLGKITFSGVTTLSINGIFSSKFTNYRFIAKPVATTTTNNLNWRIRNAGTDYSASSYLGWGWYLDYNSGGYDTGQSVINGSSGKFGYAYAGTGTILVGDILDPFVSTKPTAILNHQINGGTMWWRGGYYNVNTAADGFSFLFPNASSGTVSFYGYNG